MFRLNEVNQYLKRKDDNKQSLKSTSHTWY